jgi:hypothetical protein
MIIDCHVRKLATRRFFEENKIYIIIIKNESSYILLDAYTKCLNECKTV